MKSPRIPSTFCHFGLPLWLAHPLCMLLVLFLSLASRALGAEEGDFSYEPEGAGARVSRYLGSKAAVVIPERLGGLSVISIGDAVFSRRTDLTSVTIPNSVTTIGQQAFDSCAGLTSITIPNGVTRIESRTFANCAGLTRLTIPNSVTDIESGAFFRCTGLTSVPIPDSVTRIGESAFFNCTGFTRVTIPNSVTRIGEKAFANCAGLSNITIPNLVTRIERWTFAGCTGLTRVTIPDSVTRIEPSAFSDCAGLNGVYFRGQPTANQGLEAFAGSAQATVYYLPGTRGWGPTFGGLLTALWLPEIRTAADSFGVQGNPFGFDVAWVPDKTIVVEAATNLANPIWSPLKTLTFTGDSIHFSDPQWTSRPVRFYRLRIP